jgi:hypothetical protein
MTIALSGYSSSLALPEGEQPEEARQEKVSEQVTPILPNPKPSLFTSMMETQTLNLL